AGLILLGYGHRGSIVVLAVSVAVAGTLAGAAGLIRQREVVAAGAAATLAAFLVDFLLSVFNVQLMDLFGAGASVGSRVTAISRIALTTSLVGGLAAGVVAFWYLRRTGSALRFPGYLAAGAGPGLLLLLAEAITRIGGAQVFHVVQGLSEADRTYIDYWA